MPIGNRGLELNVGETITLFAGGTARVAAVTNQAGTANQYRSERRRLVVLLNVTAMGGAVGDTLDVYVDISFDGTTWLNAIHFPQLAGNAAAQSHIATLDTTNPGVATVVTTSDAAASAVRPGLFGEYIRGRYTLVDAGAHGQSATFGLTVYAQ